MYTLYYVTDYNAFTLHNTWSDKYTPVYTNPYNAIKAPAHTTYATLSLFAIETVNDPKNFYYTDIFKVNRDFPELLI